MKNSIEHLQQRLDEEIKLSRKVIRENVVLRTHVQILQRDIEMLKNGESPQDTINVSTGDANE